MSKKGQKQKKYSAEYKIGVIPDMGEHQLGFPMAQHRYSIQIKDGNTNTQSMSGKGNCMDNGAMENFFGRLKVELFYGEKFESVNAFIDELKNDIHYYNNERISLKRKGMSPVQFRTHSQLT